MTTAQYVPDHLMDQTEQQDAYEAEYQELQDEIEAEQELEYLAWMAKQ